MGKRITFGIIGLFALLICLYFVLSRTTRYAIDRTTVIDMPLSEKSNPAKYGFGHQPGLTYSESREPCAARDPNKKAFFGDLHVHTALSADAFPDGTRTFPDDAYRFAKGEAISVPGPVGGEPLQLQLARPLDFVSVTDHSETLGEGYICRTPGAFTGYDSKACQVFRAGGDKGVRIFSTDMARMRPTRDPSVCGEDNIDCIAADKIVWADIIRSAEEAYDRSSDCGFTSFVGYEYTRGPNVAHVHRNTIFKNAAVPELPATFFNYPSVYRLLSSLETDCRQDIEKCDVISIPHNTNISSGNAFNPRELEGFTVASHQAYRAHRQAFDRLVEIVQHKGASECLNRVTDVLGDVDELCDVENIRSLGEPARAVDLSTYIPRLYSVNSEECSEAHFDQKDNIYKDFCLSSRDYARGALLEGLAEETGHGVNPYEFGFIGSTDTHISAAGQTDEADWGGHIAYETDLEGRLGATQLGRHNRLISNPGGLAGVWAVENSRDALFQSMKRREAFATSGPRIKPRFFAGHYGADICKDPDWVATAYAKGTPMGSKLLPQYGPVRFVAQAERDPASGALAKLQIVKGWLADGHKHNRVTDIAVSDGADSLCAVYVDPDYDPAQPSYYYMRVVEIETPRWDHAQCEAVASDQRPDNCDNAQSDMIREMAWSSPIWFSPDGTEIEPSVPGHEH